MKNLSNIIIVFLLVICSSHSVNASIHESSNFGTLSSNYGGNLKNAVNTIGFVDTTIIVDVRNNVTDHLAIPSNIHLMYLKGAETNVAASKNITFHGDITAGSYKIFDANQKTSGSVIFDFGSVSEVNPVWWGADVTGVADSTEAIRSSIAAMRVKKHGSVKFPDGSYLFNQTITIDIPISFGGDGQLSGRWNRVTSAHSRVRLIWTGNNSSPAILVGGTAYSPYPQQVEGAYLHDFVLIPDAAYAGVPGNTIDGQDGIIIDGSQNGTVKNVNRLATADILLERVVVRQFGRNNFRLEGNVFDIRFKECVSTVSGKDGLLAVLLTSKGQNYPGQIHINNSYMNSSFIGTWAINFSNPALSVGLTMIGGGVSGSGNGVKLGSFSTILGTHFEGGGKEKSSIGIQVNGLGTRIMPESITKYATLIQIGTSGSADQIGAWFAAPNYMAGATAALKITEGGSRHGVFVRPHFDSITNEVANDRLTIDGTYELNYIKGNENIIAMLPKNDSTPSLLMGGDFAKIYRTNNSKAKIITDFDDGYNGQTVTIIINDSNTTFQHAEGGYLRLNGAANWIPSSGDIIMFIKSSNIWYEISRSDNS